MQTPKTSHPLATVAQQHCARRHKPEIRPAPAVEFDVVGLRTKNDTGCSIQSVRAMIESARAVVETVRRAKTIELHHWLHEPDTHPMLFDLIWAELRRRQIDTGAAS